MGWVGVAWEGVRVAEVNLSSTTRSFTHPSPQTKSSAHKASKLLLQSVYILFTPAEVHQFPRCLTDKLHTPSVSEYDGPKVRQAPYSPT